MQMNALITLNSDWHLYTYHLFISLSSMRLSIYIKTLCKAFYILVHFKLVASPGAKAESEGPLQMSPTH